MSLRSCGHVAATRHDCQAQEDQWSLWCSAWKLTGAVHVAKDLEWECILVLLSVHVHGVKTIHEVNHVIQSGISITQLKDGSARQSFCRSAGKMTVMLGWQRLLGCWVDDDFPLRQLLALGSVAVEAGKLFFLNKGILGTSSRIWWRVVPSTQRALLELTHRQRVRYC